MNTRRICVLVATCLLLPSLSLAQSKPLSEATKAAKAVAARLTSADPATAEAALAEVWAALEPPISPQTLWAMENQWVPALLRAKRYDDAAEIALSAVLVQPQNPEGLWRLRVKALLGADKPQEALVTAKGLYNVCSMRSTSQAIATLAEVLAVAYPNDPGIVRRFKLEQADGAAAQPSTSTTQPSVLSQIRVDPKPFEEAIAAFARRGAYSDLRAQGNLLLLANKPKEAAAVFKLAYPMAPDVGNHLALATESLARAMRAEDGAVGRANAWVLSLRPEPQH
jgi:hypothetical protein